MDEQEKKLLEELRAMGVKSASFVYDARGRQLCEVEFFENPSFPRLDADTIVPPAPESEAPRVVVPPAIDRILKKGSVS